jgi:hypothetical protein
MGRTCGGLLIAAVLASCTFGIDTDGLARSGSDASPSIDAGRPTHDAGLKDATHDVRSSSGSDGRVTMDVGSGSGTGGDASSGSGSSRGSSSSTSLSSGSSSSSLSSSGSGSGSDSGTSTSCSFALKQAVPGTGTYQVIQQQPSLSSGLTENDGDLLVAIAYGGQNPGQSTPATTAPNMTFTVSDTLGNRYYAGPLYTNTTSNQAAVQIFYAPNIIAGSNTVTATSAGSGLTVWTGLLLQEYSGIATSDVVDISTGRMAPSSTATVSSGTMTTGTGCDLVVGAFADGHVDGQNLSSASGWTMRSTDLWDPGAVVDNVGMGAAPGAMVNPSFTLSGGADNGWVAAAMAFRDSSSAALPQPSSVAFKTAQQSVPMGGCSGPTTIESRVGSSATRTATGISLALSGTSFYADSTCAFPITSVAIGAGTADATFYFKPSSLLAFTITASGSGLMAMQGETVAP